jgi:spermidine synthase
MVHGMTVHGLQYALDELREKPTTYYVEDSGAGLVLLNHPGRGQGLHVGILGLGAGTLAVYGAPGDMYRMYEINPVVIELARGRDGYFSFLRDSRAKISVVEGDARISLEREITSGQAQEFDVLILDTFSSDSIPIHLVTREAFALYLQHLKPDGVIAAHISNRHLDLQPVFWRVAREYHLSMIRIDRPVLTGDDGFPSEWVLLTRDPSFFDIPAIRSKAITLEKYSTSMRLWTDDYSNLFQILK